MIEALDIRVRGIVQGVGFRPFVYRLARRYIINGWVLNDLDGVLIHAEGEGKLLDEFVTELHMNPPAAAVVREVELKEVPLQDCEKFEIRESQMDDADEGTLVSADLGICDDCLRELFDPADRRYRYPFINCTNCGPRFTIIDSLPYDRPATSMATFKMCDDCAHEYADPADRRFHAQPDACFTCGPSVSWKSISSEVIDSPDDIFAAAVGLLAEGGILAVKGLGGFHLVCDAGNSAAIAELRRRKRRDGKALAVMVPDVAAARAWCEVSAAEAGQLESAARPIVLLRKRADAPLAEGLADALPELGVMLPATPVQALLVHDFEEATGKNMLVMTSGNVHDEPIVVDDDEACEKLAGIADAVLGNNRPILSRYDDSVIRVLNLGGVDAYGEPNVATQFIRRARGYAPVPITFPQVESVGTRFIAPAAEDGDAKSLQISIFAAGSEQKNTFTYAQGDRAFTSQHIGDMEDADVYDAWLESKARFEKLFDLKPTALACDMHPEYLASKWAHDEARKTGLPLTQVQHHHAHIASVLGEHGLFGPAIGIAFDGTGYGADGAIWGGEVLLANQADYERFANFTYLPMPGGAAAVKHPLRMAYGMLWAFDLLDHPGAQPAIEALGAQAAICEQMIEGGLNTPHTSSVGRLFDAVSALLGICTEPTYEGEPAILLDAARVGQWGQGKVSHCANGTPCPAPIVPPRYAISITKNAATDSSTAHDTSVVLLDAEPTIRAVLDDLVAGVPVPEIAQRFHDAIVGAIVQIAELVRAMYDISLVALSGGCFMNRYLVEESTAQLGQAGFTVALNASLPPNDGCVSYGQAVVASASR
ncbi:MAG: carbamoyltransferase HypF [Eggerthellaceae bacterium]|nr:carbamoyltransferase HypF [Eggerthellaceae bacterium]